MPVLVVVIGAIKLHNVDTRAGSSSVADAVAVTWRREHAAGQARCAVALVHLPDGCPDTVMRKGQEDALDSHVLAALVLHDLGHVLTLANLAHAGRHRTEVCGGVVGDAGGVGHVHAVEAFVE